MKSHSKNVLLDMSCSLIHHGHVRIIKKVDIKTIQSTKWGVSDSIAVKTFHELYSKKMSIYEDK